MNNKILWNQIDSLLPFYYYNEWDNDFEGLIIFPHDFVLYLKAKLLRLHKKCEKRLSTRRARYYGILKLRITTYLATTKSE